MAILLIILLTIQPTLGVYAASNTSIYAKILYDNVYLYRNPIESDDPANIYFCLPKSYFVELTDSANENFYSANYLEFSGYVKKQSVQAIIGTPQTPYLKDVSFRVYDERSRDLRKCPTLSGGTVDHILTLPCPTHNLTFYGTILGDRLIEARTNVWYFCKYTADEEYYGYVCSEDCDDGAGNMISWQENEEEVTFTTNPEFSKPKAEELTSLPIENKTTGIVIAILSVPALIFVFLIIRGSKILTKEKGQPSKEIKDY